MLNKEKIRQDRNEQSKGRELNPDNVNIVVALERNAPIEQKLHHIWVMERKIPRKFTEL
jgi:hypothetical protein